MMKDEIGLSDGSPEQVPPGEQPSLILGEVVAHLDRLTDFEVAWRALTPLIDMGDAHAGRTEARALYDRFEVLAEQARAAQFWSQESESHSAEIEVLRLAADQLYHDVHLYASRLCDHLEGTTPDRLHTYFCREDPAVRAGIAALVDFILDTDPEPYARQGLLEELVTLLATGKQGGRRCVVRDPAALTKKLSSVSDRIAERSNLNYAEIEQEFLDAARCCEPGRPGDMIRQIQERKRELGRELLAAQALRSVVFFNAASWSDGLGRESLSMDEFGPAAPGPGPIETHAEGTSLVHPGDVDAITPTKLTTNAFGTSRPTHATPDASGGVQWRLEPLPREVPTDREADAQRPLRTSRSTILLTLAAVATTLFLAAQTRWSGSEETVEVLSEARLQSISPQLASGYRSGLGSGSLFVGTVGTTWSHLGPFEREDNADEIISRLSESGLREILLYDDRHRVALHFADGLPLRIGP